MGELTLTACQGLKPIFFSAKWAVIIAIDHCRNFERILLLRVSRRNHKLTCLVYVRRSTISLKGNSQIYVSSLSILNKCMLFAGQQFQNTSKFRIFRISFRVTFFISWRWKFENAVSDCDVANSFPARRNVTYPKVAKLTQTIWFSQKCYNVQFFFKNLSDFWMKSGENSVKLSVRNI